MKILNFNKEEIDNIFKNLVVLIDTREQKNNHIIDFLEKKKIEYKNKKLDYGDYSFYIKANELTFNRDLYFSNQIVIERKNSLEELSNNLAQNRIQFENELLRKKDCKFILLVENSNLNDIITGNYNTQFNKKSYFASILTYQHRYNIHIAFIKKEYIAKYMMNSFYYFLREEFS